MLRNYYHIVFETKYSRRRYKKIEPVVFSDPERFQLKEIMIECSIKNNYNLISMAILPEHVHLLIDPLENTLQDLLQIIKGNTSIQINKTRAFTLPQRGKQSVLWAKGYFAKQINNDTEFFQVKKYIQQQHEKHSDRWGEITPVEYP